MKSLARVVIALLLFAVAAFGVFGFLASLEPGVTLAKPFAHPRSLVSDFTAGEQLLKEMIYRCLGRSLFSIAPAVILHLIGDPEGGFTQVEIRAFREMVLACGAETKTSFSPSPLTSSRGQHLP